MYTIALVGPGPLNPYPMLTNSRRAHDASVVNVPCGRAMQLLDAHALACPALGAGCLMRSFQVALSIVVMIIGFTVKRAQNNIPDCSGGR